MIVFHLNMSDYYNVTCFIDISVEINLKVYLKMNNFSRIGIKERLPRILS